jgi:hypothetical protein
MTAIAAGQIDENRAMNLRSYLRGGLWTGGLLLVVMFVSGVLWVALAAAGDQSGSQASRGVALVAIGCLLLDLVTLVVLLALAEITRPTQPFRDGSDSSETSQSGSRAE